MKKLMLTLTKEQRDQIKKHTGANINKLRLVEPTKAEPLKALRARPASIKALRAKPASIKALRAKPASIKALRAKPASIKALRAKPASIKALRATPKPVATPLFESIPITTITAK